MAVAWKLLTEWYIQRAQLLVSKTYAYVLQVWSNSVVVASFYGAVHSGPW